MASTSSSLCTVYAVLPMEKMSFFGLPVAVCCSPSVLTGRHSPALLLEASQVATTYSPRRQMIKDPH